AWDDINNYLGHIAPELMTKVEKWSGSRDLFTENRVDEQLAKALDRKVYLPSGGSLVIDRTEAMIVIDVNTGKFIGKGGNLEETVTKNNLEAAEEIARQLRLRDLGGIIVIDFIDMVLESNREQVLRRLVECLGRDRTKHQVAEVTSLGLVQMTRKRVGPGLIEAFSTTCESCAGRGIHVHMEPVDKRKLDREIKPSAAAESQESEAAASVVEEKAEESKAESDQQGYSEKPKFGRRRRRASSSGVLTPNS
ncbi:MAG: ribonuclease E/G, partial [Actinomycetota bacterium]